MSDDLRHVHRQCILQALVERRRPHTVVDLARASAVAVERMSEGDVAHELPGLVGHGYVEDLRPTRGGLYVITAKGRDQINLDAERDEYIWGRDAY